MTDYRPNLKRYSSDEITEFVTRLWTDVYAYDEYVPVLKAILQQAAEDAVRLEQIAALPRYDVGHDAEYGHRFENKERDGDWVRHSDIAALVAPTS